MSQTLTWAPYNESEVCNPDTINTVVDVGVQEEESVNKIRNGKYVSSKPSGMSNIKSTKCG